MQKESNLKFEKAIRFMIKHFSESGENSRKPVLFHGIRVGVYLYEKGYSEDVVIASLLHDVLEWSGATQDLVREEFGDKVLELIKANSKDRSISDGLERINENIQRCAMHSQDALIIKTADIIDSFKWYTSQNNKKELEYCKRSADAILKHKPEEFKDKIFNELKKWQGN